MYIQLTSNKPIEFMENKDTTSLRVSKKTHKKVSAHCKKRGYKVYIFVENVLREAVDRMQSAPFMRAEEARIRTYQAIEDNPQMGTSNNVTASCVTCPDGTNKRVELGQVITGL